MQNIIEMGRIMRDRKTIPVKVSRLLLLVIIYIYTILIVSFLLVSSSGFNDYC